MTNPLTERTIDPLTRDVRRVFVRDLVLPARIGIYPQEKDAPQNVRVNLELEVDDVPPAADRIDSVVSYEPLVKAARDILSAGHIALLETLAERLFDVCFADPRVNLARIRIEKLDAFPEVDSVGIEIERARPAGARQSPPTDTSN